MLGDIATLVVMLVVILLPLLIPVTLTAVNTAAHFRRPRIHARSARDAVSHRNEPIPASA